MAEARLGRFDHNRKNQMGWRYNSNFTPDRQDPRGNLMNNGITNKIGKLCANSGVINPNGRRHLHMIKLPFKVPLKWGEKSLNPNTILYYLKNIYRRTVKLS